MNAFVRQLAVLSVLWSFCELLLPEGKQQRMVRLTVSVLVMTALLSALNGLLGSVQALEWPSQPVLAQGEGSLQARRTALQAAANQARAFCLRQAAKAGYEAECEISLRMDGTLERAVLRLCPKAESPPLMTAEDLIALLAKGLGVSPEVFEYGGEPSPGEEDSR